LGRYTYGTI